MTKGVTRTRGFTLGEMALTQRRIGVEPMERLKWALRFAQEPDAARTSIDEDRVRLEVYAFANSLVLWDRVPARVRAELKNVYVNYESDARAGQWVPNSLEVRKIKELFGGMIEDFWNGKTIRQDGFRCLYKRLSYELGPDVLQLRQSESERWSDLLGAIPPFWNYPFRQFHFAEESTESKEQLQALRVRLMALANLFDLLSEAPPDSFRKCPARHPGGIFIATKPSAKWCPYRKCGNSFRVNKHRAKEQNKRGK